MKTIWRRLFLAIFLGGFIAVTVPAWSHDTLYDSPFIGIAYTYSAYFSDRFSTARAGATFTYGPPGWRLLRLRASLGWEPERPLFAGAGIEVPVFERFNRARGRSIGLFVLSDLSYGFWNGHRLTADAGLVALVPVTMVGGVALGGGVTHRGEPFVQVGYMAGVFPIVK